MRIQCIDGNMVLEIVIGDTKTIIRFSDEAYPSIRNDIASILTAAYEDRIQLSLV